MGSPEGKVKVMAERLDRSWWTKYKRDLEKTLRQEEIVVRVTAVEQL